VSPILLKEEGLISRVILNRPEVRNALNDPMVEGLHEAFQKAEKNEARVVILSGEGGYFCAGGDLNWLQSSPDGSKRGGDEEIRRFAGLLRYLNRYPKPIVTVVQGAAVGGGTGLVAVSDIAIADEDTIFAWGEVKLGLIPAVIAPYVISRIGISAARWYFLTGEKFEAPVAASIGLIHEAVESEDLESRTQEIVKALLSSGPKALQACKDLIGRVAPVPEEIEEYTIRMISEIRSTPEAEEGIKAVLEKRKPNW
jgi:methylglutaconyl-CoA hydratase